MRKVKDESQRRENLQQKSLFLKMPKNRRQSGGVIERDAVNMAKGSKKKQPGQKELHPT